MALAGTGAICIWNGIAPEGRDEFYAWHLHEHMPERVAIAGFLRGRRYICLTEETRPDFFTLYETVNIDVTTSEAYLARLNAPTDWTKRATAHFRDTSRALTRVVSSAGPGPGGMLATLRFPGSTAGRAAFQLLLAETARLGELAKMAQITGVHLCATNGDASALRTAESKGRSDIQDAPVGVLLIEGCTLDPLRNAVDHLNDIVEIDLDAAMLGFYRVEYTRLKTDGATG
jgi:hypothetical protein